MSGTTILAIFGLSLVSSLLVALIVDRRGRKNLRRLFNRVDEAMGRVERRMLNPARAFQPAGEKKVWVVVFTLNRKSYLLQTLADLRAQEPKAQILVIDNGSTDDTREALLELVRGGRVDKVLLNQPGSVPQWQKGFNIHQAANLLASERFDYFAWIDDDMRINRPFVDVAVRALETLTDERVRLVTLIADPVQNRVHPPVKQVTVDGTPVAIKETFSGQFVFFPVQLFAEVGLPPIREGFDELAIEDWYYSRVIKAGGHRVAAIDCSTHLGYQASTRERAE